MIIRLEVYLSHLKYERKPREDRLGEVVDKLVEENREGIEKLANEEVAEKRREETIVSKIWREVRRKLGLRKAGAKKIYLQ